MLDLKNTLIDLISLRCDLFTTYFCMGTYTLATLVIGNFIQ